ncbi:putative metal-binding motif-containing protein, partial [Candidatus Kaiserbacteria bacterium]|nr:putative metal-binding motif-containing protein [Candidatus Kaiserbacteria bacterium]
MSEIANVHASCFGLGISIGRFLSTLKNHRASGRINRVARFSRWFLTERYAVFRLSLLIAVLSLLLPSIAVAEDQRLLIDDDYGFFDGSTYFSDNRVNYCSQIDTVPDRYSIAGVWIEKREDMTAGDEVRTDVLVVHSENGFSTATTCEPEIGNIFHQGHCSFGMSGATGEENFTFDDVCLTQDVVAECFPQYIAPIYWQYYNDYWRDFGDYRTKFAVPRYMYVQCSSGMKCRRGKCVDPSDPEAPEPTDYERRLPSGTFSPPRNSVVFGPGISRPESGWRTGYSYDKVESYDPVAAPVTTALLRKFTTRFDSYTEVRDHLGSNKLAAGVCTLRTSDGEVYLSPRYDRCTGVSNPNEIQECYFDAESGSINWVRVDCPAGTVCQDHAQGARCEVADLDADDDGDGYTPRRGDCRPDDAAVHPGAADDQCEDDIDNNCDGIINDACEADEYPATCESRGLQYTGTPPEGLCCGDDEGETWNLGEGACYRETSMQVNTVTDLNILSGWSTDIGTSPTILEGIAPPPEEFVEPTILRARSAEYYSRADYAQHVGDPMVLELEYRNDMGGALQYAVNFFYHDPATDAEGYGTLAWYIADMGPTEWVPLEESAGWTRIQLEFDYDISSVSRADVRGILLKLRRLGRADSYARNARIYPKGAERAVFVGNDAHFCRATPETGTRAAVPVITYSETTSAHRSGSAIFPASNVHDACGVVEGPAETNAYCDLDGKWKPTSSDTVQRATAWIEVVGTPEIVLCYNERGEPVECPPRVPPPPPPEPPHEVVSTMYGCCATGACWSGSFCVENGGGTSSRSGTTMLCVAGEWQTEILKKDQYNHDAPTKACGSLQCFWNGESNLASAEDADDECVDNEEFKEDYQCVFGSWRSRTSMVAQQMLHMTDLGERPDEYTLFCDEPERAALNLEHSGPLAGIIRNAIYGTGDPADCGFGTGKPCVNNVCVL